MDEVVLLHILCDQCRNVFSGEDASPVPYREENDWFWVRSHHCFSALHDSALAGCHLCSLIAAQIQSERDKLDQGSYLQELDEGLAKNPRLWIEVHCSTRDAPLLEVTNDDYGKYGKIGVMLSQPKVDFSRHIATLLLQLVRDTMPPTSSPVHTSANAIVQQVQVWQSDCVANHHECGPKVEGDVLARTLPTRLLDVGRVPDQAFINLVQTSSLAARTSYITLSHRWGSRSGFKLTNERLAEYQDKIHLHDLPTTFGDTVQLVRKLGTRYLWIDMLCIIQDSNEDWRRESSTMCDIYANSELNIAAEASADSTDGLYRQRNPLNYMPCKIVTSRKGHPRQEFCLTRVTSYLERDGLLHSPLNKRAWVMQERLLAPRVLHFTPEQVIWECVSGYRSERFNTFRAFHGAGWKERTSKDTVVYDHTDMPDSSFRRSWLRLVESYSSMGVTNASDKLVAISGLAKRMDQLSKGILGEYAAGLWNSCIESQLCWYMIWDGRWYTEHVGRTGRQLTYRAPSWSWASVDDVIYHSQSAMIAATHPGSWLRVLDVQTTKAGDRFGAVSAGLIRLQGQIQRLGGYDTQPENWANTRQNCSAYSPEVGGHVLHGTVYWDDVLGSGLGPPFVAAAIFALLIGRDADADEVSGEDPAIELDYYPSPNDWQGALILTPTGDKAGQYRRVAWLERSNMVRRLSIKWTDPMLPPDLYLDVVMDHLNRRQYVIEII